MSRRRHEDEDDIIDEEVEVEEEDEYDEEEDEYDNDVSSHQNQQRNRRPPPPSSSSSSRRSSSKNHNTEYEDDESDEERESKRNPFIDYAAKDAEGSDDEEYDEDLEDLIDEEVEEDSAATRAMYNKLPSRRPGGGLESEEDIERQIREIEERYRYRSEGDGEVGDDAEIGSVEHKALLPTVKDPKLWLFQCIPGKERDTVRQILQRGIERELTDPANKLQIKSVIACDNIKGYVYIEAEKAAHVKNAIMGIRGMFERNSKLVPIREMVHVLRGGARKHIDLPRNTWIRANRGTYKGDLGQIVSYDDSKMLAVVKLIPRLDLENREVPLNDDKKKKRPHSQPPEAKFFNPREHRDVDSKRDGSGEMFDYFGSNKFKDGYLYKTMALKSLDYQNITPTFEQVQKFQEREKENDLDDSEGGLRASSLVGLKTAPSTFNFSIGDPVKVVAGELKNLHGIVQSVEGEMVTILPKNVQITDLLALPASQLVKSFKVGDNCRVIEGKYVGETGLIVKIDDSVVHLISSQHKEIKVRPSDLQECSDSSSSKLQLGNYSLHDLVQINPQTVGVIIKVERNSFKVLNNNGVVQDVRLQEMGAKKNSRNLTSLDRNHNQITVGNQVEILNRENNLHGTIIHIFRSFAFIKTRNLFENGGIVVVRTSNCMRCGVSKNPIIKNGAPVQSDGHRKPGGANLGHGGRKRDDPLLNKTVRIRAGAWKGYVGMIKDITETAVRVELHTNCKIVTVDRDKIEEINAHVNDESRVPSTPGRFSGINSPAAWDAVQTPMRASMMTPLRNSGMMTPLRSAPSTPLHDAWNPAINTPLRENAWDSDDHHQPRSGTGFSSFSPASFSNPSPMQNMGQSPATPSGYPLDQNFREMPTPVTPGLSPFPTVQTPYTPNTPATPGTPALDISSIGHYDHAEDVHDSSQWVTTGIEVKFTNSSFSQGFYKDSIGVIRNVHPDGSCLVYVIDKRDTITVPAKFLAPVTPGKNDKVKILVGDFRDQIGTLIGIDNKDGIVKLENSEIKIMEMTHFSRLYLD